MQRRSMRLQRMQPPEVPQVEAPAQEEEEYVRWGWGWGGCWGTAVCCQVLPCSLESPSGTVWGCAAGRRGAHTLSTALPASPQRWLMFGGG